MLGQGATVHAAHELLHTPSQFHRSNARGDKLFGDALRLETKADQKFSVDKSNMLQARLVAKLQQPYSVDSIPVETAFQVSPSVYHLDLEPLLIISLCCGRRD